MVDQAPAGITLRNEHGLDCVLVAMHIEDAHEFEAHIADESDLRAAGFVRLATGSDGPTDEELLRIEHEAEREECGYEELGRITRRAIANVCLALGEQKQAARVRELEAELAEYREQVHQENLLKADLDAAESELAATKAKLAEVTALREGDLTALSKSCNELSAALADRSELIEKLRKARRQRNESNAEAAVSRHKLAEVERERGHAHDSAEELLAENEKLRFELASARRVVEAARPIRRWLAKEVERRTGGGDDCHELLALLEPLERAIASAGMDADRAEVPRAEAGKPRRICYEHGPYERRCPACATEEPQPSAPKRQPEVERDDGSEQE